jgi:Protein of unknown function (DUF3558)
LRHQLRRSPTASRKRAIDPTPGATSTNQHTFPARPANLRLDGIDPCTLVTSAQLRNLDAQQGNLSKNPVPGVVQCGWGGNGFRLNNWIDQLILNRSITPTINSVAPVQTVQIDGFTALQGSPPFGDGKSDCVQLIDIADGQSLLTSYEDPNLGQNGANDHDTTCRILTKFSTMVVNNLRTMTHNGE